MTARSIEIDFDVHKAIELARTSFSETENDVLRKLLKLGEASVTTSSMETGGLPWSRKGVTLAHGTRLRMEYNGRQYSGAVENGEWVFEGVQDRGGDCHEER